MIQLPHLETNVTISCQNRCTACNHFVPLQVRRFKESMVDGAVLERDMTNFGRVAHAQAWAAIGGEPLLHPELVDLLKIARKANVADVIEVWTNGLDLPEMKADFWKAFDTLVVSLYPGVPDDLPRWIDERSAKAGVRLVIKDERTHPNFTQLLTTNRTNVEQRYRNCWFRTFSRVLDNGFFYRCCTSPFIPQLLLGLEEGHDGLIVDENLTEGDLIRFLNQEKPPASCSVCAGRNTPEAHSVPWSEEKNPEQWLRRSGL